MAELLYVPYLVAFDFERDTGFLELRLDDSRIRVELFANYRSRVWSSRIIAMAFCSQSQYAL